MQLHPINQPQSVNYDQEPGDLKPKQRRKKRTLSCGVCVERKTKCDKVRPACLSCVRRQSVCCYSETAVTRTDTKPSKPAKSIRPSLSGHGYSDDSSNGDGARCSIGSIVNSGSPQDDYISPNYQGILQPEPGNVRRQHLTSKEKPGLFNVFEIGSRHVFQNYWTSTGGLPEVIDVLPKKDQADLLVQRYFEAIDPLYPIIWRPEFEIEHERFWSLSLEEKYTYDAAQLSLQFVIYAVGAQFMEVLAPDERVNTAEFYLSASHQSLCIFSYLNCFSLTSLQTMVLICYFLVSNNHVSDAWNFSGITQRQAYGLELNRNPDLVRAELSPREKQQRCKLWQAIMFQDTSLSLYLGLPSSTMHYDIPPSYLRGTEELRENGSDDLEDPSRLLRACLPQDLYSNDTAYMHAMWEYASFVQTHICIPKSLGRPISMDPAHKAQLIAKFRNIYSSWQEPFNSYDPDRFEMIDERTVRQLIAISSNYFYVLTILYIDKNESTGVLCDVYGALDAAHEAMSAFFAHARLCPKQVDIWGTYHTRAFAQAMMIGTVLSAQKKTSNLGDRDARLMLAKSDFDRYLDILLRARGTADYEAIQRCRVADLRAIRDRIKVA